MTDISTIALAMMISPKHILRLHMMNIKKVLEIGGLPLNKPKPVFAGWKNGLTGFYIVNGYAKNEKLFKANSKVKKLKLTIDGTKEYILELEDTMNPQLFDIEYEQEPDFDKLNAVKAEFEILEVYKGEKYEDTVITTLKGAADTNMNMGG